MDVSALLQAVNDFVWGPVMLACLVGTGIFLTIRLKFLPWRNLWYAIQMVFSKRDKHAGDISPFQSLMTALSATIGTGNIVGVATAMVLGGPGALVWMWIAAAFGLSTKYGESVLAVKYRETNSVGEMAGGPMYAMKNGINNGFGRLLAVLFSVFAVLASFGIGNMTQANSISAALNSSYAIPTWAVGAVITIAALSVLVRGIRRIGLVSSIIVPTMAVFYLIASVIVIAVNFDAVPAGVEQMFAMAFSTQSVAGGIGGSIVASMLTAMRWGVARGVFSNEAGLGSAPIAAAAARTDHASRQGYVNMTGTFFDTMIICMLTGLVIASSGMLGTVDPATGKLVSGVQLTILAFSTVFGEYGKLIVSIAIALFAFSTILGWEYYGEKALEYLVKARPVILGYRVLFSLITFVGATTTLEVVWNFSDTMNGLMIIPNLICLIWLNKDIADECFEYEREVVIKEKHGEQVDYVQKTA
ncbi:alanine/glycine:cation symporter family protein [Selenomonas sp.]|uniref:alanine/glycine:cation symporter family protein n=1 Tax=Selenomonas sp. TaxID=2053611 RepID=UPI0025E0A545|nr:sodium:alanine symporter family protein [Selenomonas sp.]MCI6084736.1 sodium:alanine symporter family protein [Selenomonas sp.]MDY3296422.1 sodium:alanine symporter family protein [Selenomonas sp.]MDY4417345.1 sodium:alanine symporter family protein [Selenomonas sp.]